MYVNHFNFKYCVHHAYTMHLHTYLKVMASSLWVMVVIMKAPLLMEKYKAMDTECLVQLVLLTQGNSIKEKCMAKGSYVLQMDVNMRAVLWTTKKKVCMQVVG